MRAKVALCLALAVEACGETMLDSTADASAGAAGTASGGVAGLGGGATGGVLHGGGGARSGGGGVSIGGGGTDAPTSDGSESGSDASGGSSGSGGASDAGQDVDSGEPDPICEGLDEATCKNTPGCIALKGQQYSTGKYGFAGCAHWCAGSTSPTCGIAPDKSCWHFVDACVPDGWKLIEFCSSPAQCTATADAAAE